MRSRWGAVALAAALAAVPAGCGDDEDGSDGSSGGGSGGASGVDADAEALADCLDEADLDPEVKDAQAFAVESDHAGVDVDDLPSELLKFDSGSGTLSGVTVWVFADDADAEEAFTAITLKTEDDEAGWVDGRAVVSWYYPVDREQPQAVAVDDCVAELNG